MNNRFELYSKVLENCDIFLEGSIISKETILKNEIAYLCDTTSTERHTSALFFHTGSICYDAVAFVMCVLANIIYDENTVEDNYASLEIGSKVSYKNRLYIYEGLYNGDDLNCKGRYVLKNNEITKYITKKSMGSVLPYYGNAKELSGRGIRTSKSKREDFLKNVLSLDDSDITADTNTSTVLFMDNTELDYLLDNIRIKFEGRSYSILEIVTITYYTEKNELKKRGNPNNNEPAIKVTSSINKARELIIEEGENKVVGFVAFRSSVYKNAIDFEELLHRRKLRYSWLISKLEYNNWIIAQLDNIKENYQLAACTSMMLKSLGELLVEENSITLNLYNECLIAKNRTYHGELVESDILWQDYKTIKRDLLFIMNNCYESSDVIQFCRWSYAMLKMFNNAFFTIEEFVAYEGENSNNGFFFEISKQKEVVMQFDELYIDKAKKTLEYIEKTFNSLWDSNSKKEAIKQYVFENEYKNVLFVISSMRYYSIFEKYIKNDMRFKRFSYRITTDSKLKDMDLSQYESVIFVSLMNYDRTHPAELLTARDSVVFLYDSQIRLYKMIEKDYKKFIINLNEINQFDLTAQQVKNEIVEEEEEILVYDIHEEESIDVELQNVFMEGFLSAERYQSKISFEVDNTKEHYLEAYKYGLFTTGENILLTKEYTAYVIDNDGSVIEKNVDDLVTGDRLIFTINDNKTKDIVDELLLSVLDENQEIKDAYLVTKSWKEKFRKKKNENGWQYYDISKRFSEIGLSISPEAIRGWLDSESHIVGPRDANKFRYIGRLINDNDIEINFEKYASATSKIRSIRVKILKLIEKFVVADLDGVEYSSDGIFKDMMDQIREIAIIKQLEYIEKIDAFKIPGFRANKPLDN